MQLEGVEGKSKHKSKGNGCRKDRMFVHYCNTCSFICLFFIYLPFDPILGQNPTYILVMHVKTLNRYDLINSTCIMDYVLGYFPHDSSIYLFFSLSFGRPSEYLVQNISAELQAKLSRKSPHPNHIPP